MVVLAASIVTKTGRAVLSRQFIDMDRVRVEGLLAAFPKLMGTNQQHTYVDTESVRYVYQVLGNLYLLLITNKSSNILEDLETLHLIAKLVPDYCRSVEEADIVANNFELVCAIDEVIVLGHREQVTATQVRAFTAMDSQEEKIFEMVQRNREREAQEQAKRRIAEMEKARKEGGGSGGFGGGRGISSGGGSGSSGGGFGPDSFKSGSGSPSSYGSVGSGGSSSGSATSAAGTSSSSTSSGGGGGGGGGVGGGGGPAKKMTIKKKDKGANVLEELMNDGEIVAVEAPLSKTGVPLTQAPVVKMEKVHVKVEETLRCIFNRDGALQTYEVVGDVFLTIADEDAAKVQVVMKAVGDVKPFKFNMHPQIDKNRYASEMVLGLKDPSKAFPANNTPLGVLRWRRVSDNDDDIPLVVNCWPSAADVNIEYRLSDACVEAGVVLRNVSITIPIPSGTAPTVREVDGSYDFTRDSKLVWQLPLIDSSNASGAMEFSGDNSAASDYFPVEVSFTCAKTLCPVEVAGVVAAESGEARPFSMQVSSTTAAYQVVATS